MDLSFRQLGRSDFPLLARWLAQPHVAATEWAENEPQNVEKDFGPAVDGDDPTINSLVLERGRPVGMIQDYRIGDYPEWLDDLAMIPDAAEAVGVDYLIGEPDAIGRGLGSQMIQEYVATLWDRYPNAPGVVVGVSEDNPRSWRSLEKAGFRWIWSGLLASDTEVASRLYRLDAPDRR